MKSFQRTGIIFLTLIFLFGTTGITVYQHICSGKSLREITICPEIFGKRTHCCCADHGLSTKSTSCVCGCQSISESGCCRDISLFLKISIVSVPADYQPPQVQIPVVVIPSGYYNFLEIQTVLENQFSAAIVEPPPLSGQQRILLLHQSRIDSSSDHLT